MQKLTLSESSPSKTCWDILNTCVVCVWWRRVVSSHTIVGTQFQKEQPKAASQTQMGSLVTIFPSQSQSESYSPPFPFLSLHDGDRGGEGRDWRENPGHPLSKEMSWRGRKRKPQPHNLLRPLSKQQVHCAAPHPCGHSLGLLTQSTISPEESQCPPRSLLTLGYPFPYWVFIEWL
jgi:hypothetical protein